MKVVIVYGKVTVLPCLKGPDPGENRVLLIFLESRFVTFLVEFQANREGDTRQNTPEPKVRDNILAY